MTKKFENELFNLILKGKVISKSNEADEDIAIELLKTAAQKYPDILWSTIFEAFSYNITGMTISALAAYLCSSPKEHLSYKIKSYILDILSTLDPGQILDLTEHVKSKVFGSGLGSRNQKILRSVIEEWNIETLKNYSSSYSKEFYFLIKMLHPRFNGEKAEIVKLLTNKNT